MITTISNNWITIATQRNGVDVQRKFAGLDTFINEQDEVQYCHVKYWERELYPNGEVIKTELKYYSLEDLAYTETTINEVVYGMQPKAVLTGFVQTLGNPYIIGPARQTLADMNIFPPTVPNGYQLHLDTRPKTEV